MTQVEFIKFHQFGGGDESDELILFAAQASEIAKWAGIPRKGWKIRMLFQRPVTPARDSQLTKFWEEAANRSHGSYILGPTAITIGIQGAPCFQNDLLSLSHTPAIDFNEDPTINLKKLAEIVDKKIRQRLTGHQKTDLDDFSEDPFTEFPAIDHDYVYEFALQVSQMKCDPTRFIEENSISDADLTELITSMETICRPAIVVDGQHRLIGAQNTPSVVLPVVAIPNCDWVEQIYQFVVINEKAQKVETSILTDIFGSSLTNTEKDSIRKKLARSNTNIEERILAVIANREEDSPFYNMISLKIDGAPPKGVNPYITDKTVRFLIEGDRGRKAKGWRTDDEFYEGFVAHQFPNRSEWDNWVDGKWREYWFEFWNRVSSFYNDQSKKSTKSDNLLWNKKKQTNLTKAVSLRNIQTIFMELCVEKTQEVEKAKPVLIKTLGKNEAEKHINSLLEEVSIPETKEKFGEFVESFFLEKGIPVRVFLYDWESSLDDSEGNQKVYDEFREAWTKSQKGERYRASGMMFRRGGTRIE